MSFQAREARARRQLNRMGYILRKSRARNPEDMTYGGYLIADPESRVVVYGYGNAGRNYDLSLEDVEDWISSD